MAKTLEEIAAEELDRQASASRMGPDEATLRVVRTANVPTPLPTQTPEQRQANLDSITAKIAAAQPKVGPIANDPEALYTQSLAGQSARPMATAPTSLSVATSPTRLPVASSSQSLEDQANAAAAATEPKYGPLKSSLPSNYRAGEGKFNFGTAPANALEMAEKYPVGSGQEPKVGKRFDPSGMNTYTDYDPKILASYGLTPSDVENTSNASGNTAVEKDANGNPIYIRGVQNQLNNVTYHVPSSGNDTSAAHLIASGALEDRARYKGDTDNIEQIKGSVITGGPRAASPAMVEQQLRYQLAEGLIGKASTGDVNALKALTAINGLRNIGTIGDTLKGLAEARKADVSTTLSPGNALSERALQGATARHLGAETNKLNVETPLVEPLAKSKMAVDELHSASLLNQHDKENIKTRPPEWSHFDDKNVADRFKGNGIEAFPEEAFQRQRTIEKKQRDAELAAWDAMNKRSSVVLNAYKRNLNH